MKNPIKVRAFNKLTGEMLYSGFPIPNPIEDTDEYAYMISTRLKDFGDREVYEGDIFNLDIETHIKLVAVEYHEGNGKYIAMGHRHRLDGHKFHQYEVIGNIWENPDMMEVAETIDILDTMGRDTVDNMTVPFTLKDMLKDVADQHPAGWENMVGLANVIWGKDK
jgi:hypothetical protein